ncbi:MAG TPA: hypothetical protein VF543_20265 [Pyrinomonadaceae bacterium]
MTNALAGLETNSDRRTGRKLSSSLLGAATPGLSQSRRIRIIEFARPRGQQGMGDG